MKRHIVHTPQPSTPKGKKEPPENYKPISLISAPGKITKEILTKTTSSCMKDKKVIGKRQHRFTKGKLCPTNLIALYSGTTIHLNEQGAVSVVHLDLSR